LGKGCWYRLVKGEQAMRVYFNVPEGTRPFPSIAAIQANGGVEKFNWIVVNRLAAEGYATGPDLYHWTTEGIGKVTSKTRRQLLDDPEVMADVNVTVYFLRNNPSCLPTTLYHSIK
jgi:dienelactone hydrolase